MRTAANGNKIEFFTKKNPSKVKLAFFRYKDVFVAILEMAVKEPRRNRKTAEIYVNLLPQSQCNAEKSVQQHQQQPTGTKKLVTCMAAEEQGMTQLKAIAKKMRRRVKEALNRPSWRKKRSKDRNLDAHK
jgi:hypothetical protein